MPNMQDYVKIRKPAAQVLSLRPYQQEALQAIHVASARGVRRPLVSLPTGTGKTVLFAHLIFAGMTAGQASDLIGQAELRKRMAIGTEVGS